MKHRKLSRAWGGLVDDMRGAAFYEQADVSLLSSEELEEAPQVVGLDEALDIADKYLTQAYMSPVWRLRTRAPFSRPCYDKPHRCPGWAGGGWLRALVSRCDSGSLAPYSFRRRYWFGARCSTCHLYVLPIVTRWLDPTWIWWAVQHPRRPTWTYWFSPRYVRLRWRHRGGK